MSAQDTDDKIKTSCMWMS